MADLIHWHAWFGVSGVEASTMLRGPKARKEGFAIGQLYHTPVFSPKKRFVFFGIGNCDFVLILSWAINA